MYLCSRLFIVILMFVSTLKLVHFFLNSNNLKMSVAEIVRNLPIMLWNGMVALESYFLEVKVRLTDNNVRFKIQSFKV